MLCTSSQVRVLATNVSTKAAVSNPKKKKHDQLFCVHACQKTMIVHYYLNGFVNALHLLGWLKSNADNSDLKKITIASGGCLC